MSEIAIPVQVPLHQAVKALRNNKMNEARLGFNKPTTSLGGDREVMDTDDDQGSSAKSVEQMWQEKKEEAILILGERNASKAKEQETNRKSAGVKAKFRLRVTTGEEEENREPILFDLEELTKEHQKALDPDKGIILDAVMINNGPTRQTEAEFVDLSLTQLRHVQKAYDPSIPWVSGEELQDLIIAIKEIYMGEWQIMATKGEGGK